MKSRTMSFFKMCKARATFVNSEKGEGDAGDISTRVWVQPNAQLLLVSQAKKGKSGRYLHLSQKYLTLAAVKRVSN